MRQGSAAGILPAAPSGKGHISYQQQPGIRKAASQRSKKFHLLQSIQMMDRICAEDKIKLFPCKRRRQASGKIPQFQPGSRHFPSGNLQHSWRKIHSKYLITILIKPLGEQSGSKAQIQYLLSLPPAYLDINIIQYVPIPRKRIGLLLLALRYTLVIFICPQVESITVKHFTSFPAFTAQRPADRSPGTDPASDNPHRGPPRGRRAADPAPSPKPPPTPGPPADR